MMHVFLFDIDGTLIRSGGAGKAAIEAGLVDAFGVVDVHDGVPFSGRTDRAIMADLFRLHGIDDTPHNWRRAIEAYLARLPATLADRRGHVLPGVTALLDRLRAHAHVDLGLLTGNVREGARHKLSHYSLWDYFEFGGFCVDDFDRGDVARRAVAEVHHRHGDRAELGRVWVIGDSPHDVACAQAVGARSVAVATGWHDPRELAAAGPDLILADLSDPQSLLGLLT